MLGIELGLSVGAGSAKQMSYVFGPLMLKCNPYLEALRAYLEGAFGDCEGHHHGGHNRPLGNS